MGEFRRSFCKWWPEREQEGDLIFISRTSWGPQSIVFIFVIFIIIFRVVCFLAFFIPKKQQKVGSIDSNYSMRNSHFTNISSLAFLAVTRVLQIEVWPFVFRDNRTTIKLSTARHKPGQSEQWSWDVEATEPLSHLHWYRPNGMFYIIVSKSTTQRIFVFSRFKSDALPGMESKLFVSYTDCQTRLFIYIR